jgi:hypothetical protein
MHHNLPEIHRERQLLSTGVMLAFHDTELQVTQIQQLAQSQASNLLGRMHMVSFWFYPEFQTNSMHNLWSILQIALFM